jgi:hypothetical protein
MTKDFRHIGRTSADSQPPQADTPSAIPEAQQRIVLGTIRAAAFAFIAAGLWLLTGGASPFPEQTSAIVGIALVIAGLADFLAIAVLKRNWSKPR